MTTMDYTTTLQALRRLKVQTGSLACLGCGHEHNCSTHGCAILRNAVEHLEAALSNHNHLEAPLNKIHNMTGRDSKTIKLLRIYLDGEPFSEKYVDAYNKPARGHSRRSKLRGSDVVITRKQLEESRRRNGKIYGYKKAFCDLNDCCEVCDKKVRFICKIICFLEDLQVNRIFKICQPEEVD